MALTDPPRRTTRPPSSPLPSHSSYATKDRASSSNRRKSYAPADHETGNSSHRNPYPDSPSAQPADKTCNYPAAQSHAQSAESAASDSSAAETQHKTRSSPTA